MQNFLKTIVIASFILLSSLGLGLAKDAPKNASNDTAILSGYYDHPLGATIPKPDPLWWPLLKPAIEAARKNELIMRDGEFVRFSYKGDQKFKPTNDNQYQSFYVYFGPIWHDGDLEIMASTIGYFYAYSSETQFCDEAINSFGNDDPFQRCTGGISIVNKTTGEIRSIKAKTPICAIKSGDDRVARAKSTVTIDRAKRMVTFNGTVKNKPFRGCKVSVTY